MSARDTVNLFACKSVVEMDRDEQTEIESIQVMHATFETKENIGDIDDDVFYDAVSRDYMKEISELKNTLEKEREERETEMRELMKAESNERWYNAHVHESARGWEEVGES